MDINVILVRRLVAAQFPQWDNLPIRPVEFSGWDNRTFRLGDDMTVRLPSAKRYAAQVTKEQQWLPRLAPLLPLPIPRPLGMGNPTDEYPWLWSIYQWMEGDFATAERIADADEFARQLSGFLTALQQADSNGGPPPGPHNFHRGDSLRFYHHETRNAIRTLGSKVDGAAATAVWETALAATWQGLPVWVHGDVHPTNLLVEGGRLSAVIDFGGVCVGDPACDLTIAWTFFSGSSRQAFLDGLHADDAIRSRARGWALWKALITLADETRGNSVKRAEAWRVLEAVLRDAQ